MCRVPQKRAILGLAIVLTSCNPADPNRGVPKPAGSVTHVELAGKLPMSSRLKLDLPPGWADRSADHSKGPASYARQAGADPGVLQVSWATYVGSGPPPVLGDEALVRMATRLATASGTGVASSTVGSTPWGRFGCVTSAAGNRRIRVWVINNGPINVLVTHTRTSPAPPDPSELTEAEQIVMSIRVTEGG